MQYGVWRDSITAVVQIEPPAPEAGDALGTFALSVMPPGPEESVCFPRDIIFVFDRSGSMTGALVGLLSVLGLTQCTGQMLRGQVLMWRTRCRHTVALYAISRQGCQFHAAL